MPEFTFKGNKCIIGVNNLSVKTQRSKPENASTGVSVKRDTLKSAS